MGKNLQNELWARPVPSKLSERRPPTLFLGADTENGKKRVLFAFRPITPMQIFLEALASSSIIIDVNEYKRI